MIDWKTSENQKLDNYFFMYCGFCILSSPVLLPLALWKLYEILSF